MNKTIKALIVAALILSVFTTTAFAISKLLSAGEVAGHFGKSQVATTFDEQNITVESVTDKGYTVSFLGLVKGLRIEHEQSNSDCSYYIVSVAAADGTPLALADGNPLGMSVIIEGYPAWKINTWSLNTSANGMEENGVLYYLYDCENLEIFADKNVYLAVYEGMLPSTDVITMQADGTFAFADTYDGFKAMFRVPLDPEKADPQAAYEILKEYLAEANTPSENCGNKEQQTDAPQDTALTAPAQEETVSDDEIIPQSDMEPMADPKEKWRVKTE